MIKRKEFWLFSQIFLYCTHLSLMFIFLTAYLNPSKTVKVVLLGEAPFELIILMIISIFGLISIISYGYDLISEGNASLAQGIELKKQWIIPMLFITIFIPLAIFFLVIILFNGGNI